MNRKLILNDSISLTADKSLFFDELSTLMWGFCGKVVKCTVTEGNSNEISIGTADAITLSENDEYTVNVTETGVKIVGRDKNCLMRGYMTFLMSLICEEPKDGVPVFTSECTIIRGCFKVKNRMVHICIFPETTYEMFRKIVRLCAVLQYTHIIIEFWGMLKYDVLKELAWPFAFDKDKVKEVLEEAKAMGIIPIPMFNHFGHASQSRALNEKHVVLDQNPALAYLFTPEGWAWDIESETVYKLLASIRKELYELFGEGEYIHLGCDEAYIYSRDYVNQDIVAGFFGRITDECVAEGRRPMLWGDMFICKAELGGTDARYECNAKSQENAEGIRKKLNKKTVINDWHYEVFESPWKTAKKFSDEGFDTMVCPWFKTPNINSAAQTAKELNLFGTVQTTWHVLSACMPILYDAALASGLPIPRKLSYSSDGMITAMLIRKISFEPYDYEAAGSASHQIGNEYRNNS